MKPSSVVSRISSALTPSMPKWYETPMLGIQAPFSTNWKPDGAAVEPEPQRQADQEADGRDDVRGPAHAVVLALERRQQQDQRAHQRRVGDDREQVLAEEVHRRLRGAPSRGPGPSGPRRTAGRGRSAWPARTAGPGRSARRGRRSSGCRSTTATALTSMSTTYRSQAFEKTATTSRVTQATPFTPSPGRTSPSPPSMTSRSTACSAARHRAPRRARTARRTARPRSTCS